MRSQWLVAARRNRDREAAAREGNDVHAVATGLLHRLASAERGCLVTSPSAPERVLRGQPTQTCAATPYRYIFHSLYEVVVEDAGKPKDGPKQSVLAATEKYVSPHQTLYKWWIRQRRQGMPAARVGGSPTPCPRDVSTNPEQVQHSTSMRVYTHAWSATAECEFCGYFVSRRQISL